ncbi:hypothetical protein ACA910_012458 [Epithemia clementina (nom. ined.)]
MVRRGFALVKFVTREEVGTHHESSSSRGLWLRTILSSVFLLLLLVHTCGLFCDVHKTIRPQPASTPFSERRGVTIFRPKV